MGLKRPSLRLLAKPSAWLLLIGNLVPLAAMIVGIIEPKFIVAVLWWDAATTAATVAMRFLVKSHILTYDFRRHLGKSPASPLPLAFVIMMGTPVVLLVAGFLVVGVARPDASGDRAFFMALLETLADPGVIKVAVVSAVAKIIAAVIELVQMREHDPEEDTRLFGALVIHAVLMFGGLGVAVILLLISPYVFVSIYVLLATWVDLLLVDGGRRQPPNPN